MGAVMNQDPVIAALEQQVDCYRKLARLAELQHVYVQQSQTEELLQLLSSRQLVLDQIADLEQTISPAKKRWSEFLTETDDPTLAQSLLAETKKLLEEITTSDRNDAMVLQQRKLNLGKQIGQATVAKNLNRNYAAAAYGRPQSRMDLSR
jgi:hypothetical protein